jgi:hypothetical protein
LTNRLLIRSLDLLKPGMPSNISDRKTIIRISVKNLLYQIFTLITHKLRDLIVSVQDLLIQVRCLGIFKWKISTYHCEQYNSWTPNICLQTIVSLTGYHL